jgi:hypothetical protein
MPHTFTVGELVTAATLNGLGTWVTYTSTWSGTIGNGTNVAAYMRIGDTVSYRIKITWGTTTSHAASTQTLTLPTTPVAAYAAFSPMGTEVCLDAGVNAWSGHVQLTAASGTTINFTAGVSTTTPAATGQVTNTVPMTWGNGDVLMVEGTYQST